MESWIADLPAWAAGLRLEVLARLLLATVLGGAIGLEREISGKPAGLRTNILICVGAALFTEASLRVAAEFATGPRVQADPGRIAYGIVSGIGFIGAGTILVLRGTVIGLTSAATLWVVAAIGMTVGLRDYPVAIGGTLLVLLTLAALARLENRFSEKSVQRLEVRFAPDDAAGREIVETILAELGLQAHLVGFGEDERTLSWGLHCSPHERHELLERLARAAPVRGVRVD
ncbi:MAG: MgtC/SapB family protein [Gemmatimonadota bacterium]|nr:MgtC/SapB family protein [Gemmatimonadota bacterium]